MSVDADRLRRVFAAEDMGGFYELLDPEVTWTWWEPEPACRNRDDVCARIEEIRAEDQSWQPEIVAEVGERVVIDPHPKPPLKWAPELTHVYTFAGGRIVRMEDYPDRKSALEAVGLS